MKNVLYPESWPLTYLPTVYLVLVCTLKWLVHHKGVLAIRRIFSLVDMIAKPKF